ncbi:unnamed protein product [Pelagomonas calceolata]|uniref:Bicarbonate transporter-like transmembrane domain-containing protein n=1 Tax=Pelagomonas calceolata TaxID=35677 RepID=A0A7S3ZVQ7_9STRA|nr:unnamed protein product [Pelagomonas calceolata]|mmetsp:Transcript_1741/g.4993  ORF Transcript_1741/g.4993 Transcript_1741/m.4993 type:complete len:562 (+) Transcript_1741:186-1871(+)
MAPRRFAVLLLPALCAGFRSPSFARKLPRLPKAETATAEATPATTEKVKLVEGFGVGIRRDVKARLPFYKSDIKDGVSVKSVSALLYLFFACLAPAVAFGSVQGATTKGAIGAVEYVASTAICGVVYALASAQPLTIIGSTGPVLAFTSVLYGLSTKLGVPFLPLYAWTGLWSSLYLFLGALFSTSNGVTLLTRFTDEIFSNLISTIFVYEAARDVVFGALLNPSMAASEAFAVAATACTTFGSATWLAARRGAESLKRGVRNFLADFAPAIGICLGILAGGWCGARAGVPLQKLAMPATFSTTSGRPWLVPLGALPVKYRWLASLPALMVAVLLFFDQNITVRIVNAESNKLKKPVGYHQDLLVVSLLAAGCSVVGFPWLVAATVRSINHVRANSVYEDVIQEGDCESSLEFVGCKEQRVTGLAIHAAIGGALLFGRKTLARTPKAALMGLFLYLGTSALKGNQMFARSTELLGGPLVDLDALDASQSKAKDRPWAAVPRNVTRGFTLLQIGLLASMMLLKNSPLGVGFPIIIAALGPLRSLMLKTKLVKPEEMALLDQD